mgnify:CR=1 FL=1|tara:strand:- start:477 stop:692 length:216 start_codon:yes stop_codon:yes gene_type:complete
MKDKKTERKLNWEQYHTTREVLLSAIEMHLKSIGLVNVYDPNSDFNDGSWEMMNESMGTTELNKLKERLKI